MRRAPARMAHIVQAIKGGDEVEVLFRDVFCVGGLKAHPTGESMLIGVTPRLPMDGW